MMKKLLENKRLLFSAVTSAILLIVCIGLFIFYTVNLKAPSNVSKVVNFEIKQGENINQVIANLDEATLLKNKTVAKIYVKINSLNEIKAGTYVLNKNMSLETILDVLTSGKGNYLATKQVTFKEGMWAKDVAALIEKELNVSAEECLDLWNDQDYIKELMSVYPFLSEDLFKKGINVSLEGYLFPQTYKFGLKTTPKVITAQFLDQFNLVYKKHEKMIKASDMSIQDIVKMASMVQYEAKEKKDMYLVAGVFKNRLNRGQKLESSVTVCYALYDEYKTAEDCEINPTIDSPYNTYLYEGLPVGAILNPGEVAIQAVLNPTPSDYLYFVADIYGDGSMHYATTFEEHNANIIKYNLNK